MIARGLFVDPQFEISSVSSIISLSSPLLRPGQSDIHFFCCYCCYSDIPNSNIIVAIISEDLCCVFCVNVMW